MAVPTSTVSSELEREGGRQRARCLGLLRRHVLRQRQVNAYVEVTTRAGGFVTEPGHTQRLLQIQPRFQLHRDALATRRSDGDLASEQSLGEVDRQIDVGVV